MTTPSWQALQDALDGELVLPDAPGYGPATLAFNARFDDVRPEALARCATLGDVAETIAFAARHDLHAVPRCGGHCFAGHSATTGVIIDVTPMHTVVVDAGLATIGAGARLGDVYEALQAHGLAIPGGTCPGVGIAGLTLGGGLGILGRKHGLTCDQLVAAEIVLADGRIVICDEGHDEQLFWALRGAGAGTFGVVTSFVFRTVPAPRVHNFHLVWPDDRAAAAVAAWQGWAPTARDELAASLKITTTDEQPSSVDIYGALVDDESEAALLMDDLVARVGADPSWGWSDTLSFRETRRFWAQLPVGRHDATTAAPTGEDEEHPYLFSKSEFFARPLPTEAIDHLLATYHRQSSPGQARELDFMPWGGAYTQVPVHATAFAHRHELFQLKHSVVVDPEASSAAKQAALRHVQESWASVHPWASGGVFPNFADPDLDPWADAYHGPNLGRLLRIKARYDPTGFFDPRPSASAPDRGPLGDHFTEREWP
jgi:FAD/FMN-containing dehydrogenase